MVRATTPKHSFIFDVDPEETLKTILITYAQNDKIVLEKHKEDLTFIRCESMDGKPVYIAQLMLTQEETKLFSAKPKGVVSIQVRAITNNDEAIASEIEQIPVSNVLNDEVLV